MNKVKLILFIIVFIAGVGLGVLINQRHVNQTTQEEKLNTQSPIKIGTILPLTGKYAQYAEEARRGIELALQDENLPIEIIYEDSKGEPKEGVSAYQRLKLTNPSAIISGSSVVSLAITPLANQDQTLQVAVFSSVSEYSSANDFTFRVTPRAELENKTLVDWIIKNNYKTMDVLYVNNEWGVGHLNVIKKNFEQLGGRIINEKSFLITDTDFKTQLTHLKDSQSENILLIAQEEPGGMILNQAKKLSIEKQFFAVRAIEGPDLLELAKDAAEGIIYPFNFDLESNRSQTKEFNIKYEQQYQTPSTLYVAEGYDAMKLIIKSIKECGNTSSQCMKDNLLQTKNYPGVLGKINFNENGDVSYPFFIKTVRNGEFVKY